MGYYDEISDGYAELHGSEQLKKAKIIAERVKPTPNETLLDVGCGDGAYLNLFRCDVVGIDPSEALLDKYTGNHQVLVGSAEALPFDDEEFDIVISITAVQNFDNIEKGLGEMNRVCKDRLAISTLKRGPKAAMIDKLIKEIFAVESVVEEDKDYIYFCKKK